MNKILKRVERRAGIDNLASILADRLRPTELQSLLLEVFKRRASRRQPAEVLEDYQRNRFVRPAGNLQDGLAWLTTMLDHLPPDMEPLELSPVCPLGTCSATAAVDPSWSVPTIRNTEVVSDCTNVLGLECALRRRQLTREDPRSLEIVRLATSQRLLRPQLSKNPRHFAHFSLFGMVSAGRDVGNLGFEIGELRQHLGTYLRALETFLEPHHRFQIVLSNFGPEIRRPLLEAHLLQPLRDVHLRTECLLDTARTAGRGYYRDLCFKLNVFTREGELIELGDGGSVDWTRKLLGNAKERLVISGVGNERICALAAT